MREKPVIAYSQKTWKLNSGEPMHAESGYWRPKPDGTIEVVIAQSTGVVEVQVICNFVTISSSMHVYTAAHFSVFLFICYIYWGIPSASNLIQYIWWVLYGTIWWFMDIWSIISRWTLSMKPALGETSSRVLVWDPLFSQVNYNRTQPYITTITYSMFFLRRTLGLNKQA